MSLLSDTDLYLFNEGRHLRLYDRLGAHLGTALADGTEVSGCHFAVWAPNAAKVSVIGDWNDWNPERNPLTVVGASGIHYGFAENVKEGQRYVYQ
ncbi:MAG TPA: 1,4-alpha-glucan branching enzyme, partial [Pseudomonadota bacterium]|nr:1,4-alpha-glucan branching enzyme [Pseudomonadota bacterium]